jgi:oligopeptide/dipeptide ABC transporter ATP-binding protein
VVLKGEMPDAENPPPGCPFHPRCPKAMEVCGIANPNETNIGSEGRPHIVRCHLY